MPDRARLTKLAVKPRAGDHIAAQALTSEGSRAVRYHTTAIVPPARYEVILVSPCPRCRLRGRHRPPVANTRPRA